MSNPKKRNTSPIPSIPAKRRLVIGDCRTSKAADKLFEELIIPSSQYSEQLVEDILCDVLPDNTKPEKAFVFAIKFHILGFHLMTIPQLRSAIKNKVYDGEYTCVRVMSYAYLLSYRFPFCVR